ncbi:MAG: ferritin-like domain-containing protein [Gaiellaceae bacterium]
MSELDGVWDVRRTGGFLPPLVGVRKEIHGTHGKTLLPGGVVGVPFDVVGHELHYRAPFAGFADIVVPHDDGFSGRATFRRRTFGRFELMPIKGGGALTTIIEQLIKHIDEAHAMEQNVLRMLDTMISTTDDPEILQELEHHKIETEGHAQRMRSRLEAHGAQPSTVKQAAGILGALAKLPLDMVRGEKAGRNARDGYATEHMEIASYELLKRVAQRANDEETASDCDLIIEQERAMAETIAANWEKFTELSLREAGVPVP